MRNLRIGTKLAISFSGVVLLLACVAVFATLSMAGMNALTAKIVDDRIPKMVMAGEIANATSGLRDAEAEHILANDPVGRAIAETAIRQHEQLVESRYATLDPKVKKPKTRAALDAFKKAWDAYVADDRTLRALSRAEQNDQAIALLKGPMETRFTTLAAAADTFSKGELELAADSHADAASAFDKAKLALAMAVSIALIGTLAILLLLIRLIARPLVGMTRAMAELAAGDMHASVPVDPRRDEIGDLATAMASFRDQLCLAEESQAAQTDLIISSIGNGLERLAIGDVTARLDVELTGPFAKLRADFNAAMENLETVLGAVSEASGGVSSGASEISAASNDLSRRTEQQAASLEETAAAMDEITTTVREAAASAIRANKAAQQARTEAEHSGEVVGRAIQAMSGIERASSEISEIISVIDGIAFQTNLLALNAGVEAARAGDAGKGFAVVASEVRALAQRSADAAKDVKTRVTASSKQVDAGVTLVSETEAALRRIITSISELDTLVADIATSAEQQASGLQQVNTAVAEMDGVTQQNAAMVEQATAASRSLAAQADALASQIGRFKVQQHSTPPTRRHANPVHQLQARAAHAQPRSSGNTALDTKHDHWAEF